MHAYFYILFVFALNAFFTYFVLTSIWSTKSSRKNPAFGVAAIGVFVYLNACFLLRLNFHLLMAAYLMLVVCISSVGLPGNAIKALTHAFGRFRFPIYLLSVATIAVLSYVHLPITTFLTSPGEIGLHLEYVLTTNARAAMVVIYLAAALYGVAVSPRMRSVLGLMALTGLAVVLAFSFVLPIGYPAMNGLMFEQIPLSGPELAFRTAVDLVVIALISAFTYKAVHRFGGKPILTALLLLNLSLGLSSVIAASREGEDQSGGPTGEVAALDLKPLEFSAERENVLIVFLDRFMGGFTEGILDAEPDLATRLDGFTWYPRTVAAGDNSIAGVHPIFGGYDYTPRQMNARRRVLRDLSVEAFSILPYNFSKKGWSVQVVNPRGLGFTMAGDCSFLEMDGVDCTHVPPVVVNREAARQGFSMRSLSEANYSDLLVLLGLMRVAPYAAKAVLSANGPWRPFLDHSAGTTFREWAELKSLPSLTRTDSAQSNLNVFWSILPHEPYFMGEDCRPRNEEHIVPEDEVARRGYTSLFAFQHAVAARCSLRLVADYLDWLKAENVYDNTRIVVVSDHGIIGPVEDHSARAEAGGTTSNKFVASRSVLFVKERDAHGPLAVSETFKPNAEVPQIVCAEIGGCINPFLDDRRIETAGRDRPFYVVKVPWQFNAQHPDAFVIEEEAVVVDGDPYDIRQWRPAP